MADTAEIYQFPGAEKHDERPRSPQLEDGFTRISNPLFEDIIGAPLTDRERRVVLAVVRLTYGWNKKAERVYAEDVAKITKLHESRCSKVISELVRRNVIVRQGGSRSPITLNKDIDTWEASNGSKRKAPTKRADSAQNGPVETAQNGPTYKDMKDIPPLPSVEGEGTSPKSGKATRPTKSKPTRLDLSNLPAGVSTEAVQGFIEHRKALKKPLTQRALTLNVNEALRAAERIPELTADQALDETVLAGWQGVKADWLANRLNGRGRSAPRQNGRVGMAQPKAQGTYTPTDTTNLPDWMRD